MIPLLLGVQLDYLERDGTVVVVGRPSNNSGNVEYSGRAQVFQFNSINWKQLIRNSLTAMSFGFVVDIFADGKTSVADSWRRSN